MSYFYLKANFRYKKVLLMDVDRSLDIVGLPIILFYL